MLLLLLLLPPRRLLWFSPLLIFSLAGLRAAKRSAHLPKLLACSGLG